MRAASLLMMLALLSMPVAAGTYKCESGGQVSYGDRPCDKGQGQEVAIDPPLGKLSGRSLTPEAQRRLEKQKAEALRKERLRREKAEEKADRKAASQARKAEKKKKARCKSLAKALARRPDPVKRQEYERECRDE